VKTSSRADGGSRRFAAAAAGFEVTRQRSQVEVAILAAHD
jgi:hypothetical protein